MLVKSSSEVRAGLLIGFIQSDPVEVVVGPQLHDAVNKAEGLNAGVGVGGVLGDDLEHRPSNVRLTVGSDVWASLTVNDPGHRS